MKRQNLVVIVKQILSMLTPEELEEVLPAETISPMPNFNAQNPIEVLHERINNEIAARAHITNNIFERLEDLERVKIADIDSPKEDGYLLGGSIYYDSTGRPKIRTFSRRPELSRYLLSFYIKKEK